jgi:glycosyltransferase involved in cell wall biosynthesis
MVKFAVCIPTINRWSFLESNIPKYLASPSVSKVFIRDENGEDAAKIKDAFGDNPRLVCQINAERLGPFGNKLTVCRDAVSAGEQYLAIIDSDNYAPEEYFEAMAAAINVRDPAGAKPFIYMPSFARPNFDCRNLRGATISDLTRCAYPHREYGPLLNMGNYVISATVINQLVMSEEETAESRLSDTCDCVYFLLMVLTKIRGAKLFITNAEYDHTVHDGSIYLQFRQRDADFNELIYHRWTEKTSP